MQYFAVLIVHCCLASLPAHHLKVFINIFTRIPQEAETAKINTYKDFFIMVFNITIY